MRNSLLLEAARQPPLRKALFLCHSSLGSASGDQLDQLQVQPMQRLESWRCS